MPPVHYALSVPLSVLPALVLLRVFRWLDHKRPVPRRALYITLVLGALACVPAAVIEALAHAVLGDASLVGGRFVDAFIVTALPEEALKLAIVLAYPYRYATFDEVMDGVVYTVAASLGLGLLENVAYAADDVATGILRALTAVPMHATAAGVMGYFVGRARFVSTGGALPLAMAGLFFGVAIHGCYDWAVFNRDAQWFGESLTVLLLAGALLAVLVRSALRFDESMLGRQSLTAFAPSAWPTEVTQTLVPDTVLVPVDKNAVSSKETAA